MKQILNCLLIVFLLTQGVYNQSHQQVTTNLGQLDQNNFDDLNSKDLDFGLLNFQNKFIKVDLQALVPQYEKLVESQVDEKIQGEVDYSNLEVVEVEFDIEQQPALLPYDPKVRFGQGYDVANTRLMGSPFISSLLNEGTHSVEGQDGVIKFKTITSTEDMAESLAVDASVFGSGWGVTASASFAMNKQSSISENQVIVQASHTIDLGKAFIKPSLMLLTKMARTTLATNKVQFNKEYGTHFIAGALMGCSMNIQLKKTCKSTDDKLSVAASLEAEYKGVASIGASAKVSMDKSKSKSDSSIDISIIYAGNNDNVFIEGLDIESLQDAILKFPENCNGNVNSYILWPYEKSQSYLNVIEHVQQSLIERKRALYYEVLKEKKLTNVQLKIEQQKYMKDVDFDRIKAKAAYETALSNQKKFNHPAFLLNQIFLKAVIKNKLFLTKTSNEKVKNSDIQSKEDREFDLLAQEAKLDEMSTNYNQKLKALQDKKGSTLDQALQLVRQALKDVRGLLKDDVKYNDKQDALAKEKEEKAKKAAALKAIEQKKAYEKANTNVRFVRVRAGSKGNLQISQLQVFDNHNIERARKKPVTSSSDTKGMERWKAVDGHALSRPQPNLFHSKGSSNQEWWYVDLKANYFIKKVVYYNRKDCCQDRSIGMKIELLDSYKRVLKTQTLRGGEKEIVDFE